MPGCQSCRNAADLDRPEIHCRKGGTHCTCQCRVTTEDGMPNEEVVDRELEDRFTEILTNRLTDFSVPPFEIEEITESLVEAMEQYAYGSERTD